MFPIVWEFNELGNQGGSISLNEIVSEFSLAADVWESQSSNTIDFEIGGVVKNRLAIDDGVFLVSFSDDTVEFPPGVVGLAINYVFSVQTTIDDTNNDLNGDGVQDIPNGVYPAGTIYDSNVVFKGGVDFSVDGAYGSNDIRAIAIHEIGHALGFSHSSIQESVMWPFGKLDVDDGRTLGLDDISIAAFNYPNQPTYDNDFGKITGVVNNGSSGAPVVGAHVYAVDIVSGIKVVGSYTGLDGNYKMPIPVGEYFIGIEPLDGDPKGMDPERINDVIAGTNDTSFIEELFDANESSVESDPRSAIPVVVAAGTTTSNIDFQTNITNIPGVNLVFTPGPNYFTFPVSVSEGLDAFQLISLLGDETEINAIERLNPQSQLFERTSYLNGVPVGTNFPIENGVGYILYAKEQFVSTFRGDVVCDEVNLSKGINLIAVACPPPGFTSLDLIQRLGSDYEIKELSRFDSTTQGFETVQYIDGVPAGDVFYIANGEAYIVESNVEKFGLNISGDNTIFPPAIMSISPGRGLANDFVLIQGQGFSENITDNFVYFNGVSAHVVFASPNVIGVVVPSIATRGDVVVVSSGKESNAIEFVVESPSVNEADVADNYLISGQDVSGSLSSISEQDRYQFLALEDSFVTIEAVAASSATDLFLALEGPDGEILVYDDDSGTGSNALISSFQVSRPGIYTAVVSSITGLGEYSLSVNIQHTTSEPSLTVLDGDAQSAVAGTYLDNPLEIYVASSTGEPLVGVPVTFTATNVDLEDVSTFGYSLQNAGTSVITTNIYGIAKVEALTPDSPGVYDITVTVPGFNPVTMQVSTIATPVAQVLITNQVVSCGGEGCPVGETLDVPYQITYLNAAGNPVSNAFTKWTVVSGEGSLENFNPTAGSNGKQLTDSTGSVSVYHKLGEKLYFELDGELTSIKVPQMVAASIPGREQPALFSAVSKAGPPATIESLTSNYTQLMLETYSLNGIRLNVKDRFGNPVEGAEISVDNPRSDEITIEPGLSEDGRWFTDYETDASGNWVGLISAPNDTARITLDEFFSRESVGLADQYVVEFSEFDAGSVEYLVDVHMGPVQTFVNGHGARAFVGISVKEFTALQIKHIGRPDLNENGSFLDEGFGRVNSGTWSTEVTDGIIQLAVEVQRVDGLDPAEFGLSPPTVNGERKTTVALGNLGAVFLDLDVGDVAGPIRIISTIETEMTRSYPGPGGDIFVLPREIYATGSLTFEAVTHTISTTIDADRLSGLDWTSINLLLNGNLILDVADEGIPELNSFPRYLRVFIDGAEQVEWPSTELLEAGGFNQLRIEYGAFASELNRDAYNAVAFTAETEDFEGNIESVIEQQSFNSPIPFTEGELRWEINRSFESSSYFTIGRTISYAVSQEDQVPTERDLIGSFKVFDVNVARESNIEINILDADENQIETLISQPNIGVGQYKFVLLREDISELIRPISGKHDFYLEVNVTGVESGDTRVKRYSGELKDVVTGEMLGQIIQHDTKIQDGSASLRREDLSLSGAGPQLTFIRNYSNKIKPENRNSVLGEGWSHNHEIFLKVLSTADTLPPFNENLPGWVANTRLAGQPALLSGPSLIQIMEASAPLTPSKIQVSNGGVFDVNSQGEWVPQRGNHGKLTGNLSEGFVFTSKDGSQYEFELLSNKHGQHLVSSIEDRNGNRLTYEYENAANNERLLQTVTDQSGRYLSFNYDESDNGKQRLVELEAVVASQNSPENITLQFDYYRATDEHGGVKADQVDEVGMLRQFARDEFTETYDYEAVASDNVPNLVSVEDANGEITQYQYLDPQDVPSDFSRYAQGIPDTDVVYRVCYPAASLSCTSEYAQFDYDVSPTENARVVTDLRGNETRYELNFWGNPTRIEEPEGKITEFDWTVDLGLPDNLMAAKRDVATNAEWRYEYDAQGNLTLEVDPYNNRLEQEWDQEYSVLTERVDKNGHRLVQQLDSNGNVRFEIRDAIVDGDPANNTVTIEHRYGSRHGIGGLRLSTRNTTTTEVEQYVTYFDYDSNGNLREKREPEGSVSTYDFNDRGLLETELDPNGNRTVYRYDNLDRLTHTIDDYGNTVENRYDPKGNKTFEITSDSYQVRGLVYSRELTYEYEYDERDRVERTTRTGTLNGTLYLSGEKEFDYDGNSNLVYETDWKGVATRYGFDGINRNTSTTNRLGNGMSINYQWFSGQGYRKSITDYEGNTTVERYDLLGRKVRVDHPQVTHIDGEQSNYYRQYFYDNLENVVRIIDEENNQTDFVYGPRYLKIEKINAEQNSFVWQYDARGNLSRTIDEESNEVVFEYDGKNRLSQKTEEENHITTYRYYPNNLLQRKTDPWGFSELYTYDRVNQLSSITNPDGIVSVTNTKFGELVYRRDAENRESSAVYAPEGRKVQEMDARGRITNYVYDNNGNVANKIVEWPHTVTGPQQVSTLYKYDGLDRTTHLHDGYQSPIERVTEYRYDRQGNKTDEINPQQRTIHFDYDEMYRVINIVNADTGENLNRNSNIKYDGVGNKVWEQNRRGFATTTEYDDLNRPWRVTDAYNNTIVTTYDNVGNVKTVRDRNGNTKESFYDGLYRVTEQFIESPEGARFRLLTNEYDIDNTRSGTRTNAVVDANGNRVVSDLNFRSKPTRIELPASSTVGNYAAAEERFEYDRSGWLTATIDAENNRMETTYFNDGSVESSTDAELNTTQYEYDIFANQVLVTKPKGNFQQLTYDQRNRLVSATNNENIETRYEYDVNNNLRHQYMPAPQSVGDVHVEYTYDTLNRKRAHIQHKTTGNLVATYRYDAEGNLNRLVDANQQQFTYEYDRLNRLENTLFPANDDITRIHNTYDANGNLDVVTEYKPGGNEVSDYDYDLLNRKVAHIQRGRTINYAYDNNGNRTSVSSPGGSTSYVYDSRNRLYSVTAQGAANSTTYSYLQNGWLDTVNHANNTAVDYDYYPDGMVQSIENRNTQGIISRYDYTYDRNNNRDQQTEVQPSFSTASTLVTDYVYDTLDRLESYTEAANDSSYTSAHVFTYYPSYDRASETVTENGVAQKDRMFQYDETYWLTQITESAGTAGTVTYAYDNNGNTLTKRDTTNSGNPESVIFTYNKRNQLKTVASGAVGAESNQGSYHYNHKGLRIRHLNSTRGNIEYLHDDTSVIDELQNQSTTQLAHYRYGDRLLSLQRNGEQQFYQYASLGTTANLSNASGETQVSYRVDPFGDITRQEGESFNRHVFTGHEHDEETGLIYMEARFYDPDVGRFLNQDTYLGENNTPPSLHRYLYAYANPNYFVDPTGQWVAGVDIYGATQRELMGGKYNTPEIQSIAQEANKGTLYAGAAAAAYIGGTQAVSACFASVKCILAVEAYGLASMVDTDVDDVVGLLPVQRLAANTAEIVNIVLSKTKKQASKVTAPKLTSETPIVDGDIQNPTVELNEVILDTNAVKGYKEAQKQLKPGETPVVTQQTIKELEELRDRPTAKAFTQDTVDFAETFKIIDDVDTLDSVKKVRSRQMELTETNKLKKQGIEQEFPDANKIQGLEGDGIIGSTVLETKRPIITDDKDFADTLESLGAEVRKTK